MSKAAPFFLALLLMANAATATTNAIADLEKELTGSRGTARVDLLNRLSFTCWSSNPQKGITYGRAALELSRQLNFSKGIARALNCIGLNYYLQGDYGNALDLYKQSLDAAHALNDKALMANTLNNMARLYSDLGSNDLALDHYFQTLKLKEETQDAYGQARVLNNIGEIYLELKHYDEALTFLQKSLTMKQKDSKDQEGLATSYQNIGEIYRTKGDFKTALENYRQSLQISQQTEKKSGIGDAYLCIAELELSLQHTEKALGAFRRSLQIREELGDKKGIATCLNRIGVIYTQMGNYPKAQATSEKALHLAEEVTNKSEMINSLEHLADLHAAQGNYQRALQYMREFTRIKDQVFTQESSQKIANLGIVYENQQKQKEIEVQRLKIERQKTIVYLAVVIIGLVLLSLFFLFYRYHLKVRHNLQLEQMNVQLDLLNRTDPLTQLANRRDFVEKIQYEIVRYLRSCKTFSVVLGDIDDFKQINDRHGHQCGDYVLRTVAQLIRAAARGQDVVARWGGEEFILLLPETEPLGGKILSERICAKIAGQRFEHNGQQLKVTMTFGVAAYIDGLRLDDCIARADQAMYKGKIAGKNRVVLLEA